MKHALIRTALSIAVLAVPFGNAAARVPHAPAITASHGVDVAVRGVDRDQDRDRDEVGVVPSYWGWGGGWWYDPYWYDGVFVPPANVVRVVPRGMLPLRLHVHPRSAEVKIDGNDLGEAKEFGSWGEPLYLKPGRHVLKLSAPGYEPLTVHLDTSRVARTDLHYRLEERPEAS